MGIKSEVSGDDQARVQVDVEMANGSKDNRSIDVMVEIFSLEGQSQTIENISEIIPKNGMKEITINRTISNLILWDRDNPALYTAKIQLYEKGHLIDEYFQDFGIRAIDY